jgi:two-component system, LytTR family, response regulator
MGYCAPHFIALLLEKLEIAMENTATLASQHKMMVATAGRVDVVNIDDLVRIEAQSNYSRLFFTDGTTLLVAKVLRKFEEQLSQAVFVRSHKTHLVNMHFIRSYEGKEHKFLVLENGDTITVARSKQRWVMQQLMGF